MLHRIVLLGVFAVPATSAAQSFHLHAANVSRDGEAVGEVSRLTVEIVRWVSPTTARVRHVDDAVELEVDVETTDENDYLAAGVGKDVTLRVTGDWRITMLAGTWAPVLRGSAEETRIALPPQLPVSWARLAAGTPPAAEPPVLGPWDYDLDASDDAEEAATDDARLALGDRPEEQEIDSSLPHCPGLTMYARPETTSAAWVVPDEVYGLSRVATRGRWIEARVDWNGFVVHGFVEASATRCEGEVLTGLGMSGGGGCGDGIVYGRAVVLPAGTELFATADAEEPFATLRKDAVGFENQHNHIARGCDAEGNCERFPPEPQGTTQWIVELSCGAASGAMILNGFVKTPAEDLADRDPDNRYPGGGFGMCTQSYDGWPRPASPSPPVQP